MEPHALQFPSFMAPLRDLYGASSFRVGEALAYQYDLDELDRDEMILERTVRALVDRPAPMPIGVAFHHAHVMGVGSSSLAKGRPPSGATARHHAQRTMSVRRNAVPADGVDSSLHHPSMARSASESEGDEEEEEDGFMDEEDEAEEMGNEDEYEEDESLVHDGGDDDDEELFHDEEETVDGSAGGVEDEDDSMDVSMEDEDDDDGLD